MAEKRMFTKKIVDSDPFKEMPLSTQALYFHLGMNADDEGFLNNAKSVQRSILATEDDMKLLIAKNFIIPFESGVVVIKHWKMHNQIQPSKLKPTQYTEEKKLLGIKENKSYTLIANDCRQIADGLPTDCRRIADVSTPSVDKCSVDKSSVVESSVVDAKPTQAAHHQSNIPMTENEYNYLVRKYGKSFVDSKIERAKKYPNTFNYQTISKWCEEDKKKQSNTDQYNSFAQNTYDFDALEKDLLENKEPDPDFERRRDELQNRLKDKYKKDK